MIKNLPACFKNQSVVANLEGAIVHDARSFLSECKVFNSEDVLPFIKNLNIKVVSIGNNHITDATFAFSHTCNCLKPNEISCCGAVMNRKDASKPAMITENGVTYAFLSFGWDVISCKYVSDGVLGVNPLEKR